MTQRQRLFFALWPDDSLRSALAPLLKLKRECGGRAHPADNLHMTVNFLGGVDTDTRDCAEQAASDIVIPPFELELDHFGYWSKPKVVWLGCRETPRPLQQLVSSLNDVVTACGLQKEERPYRPHVTLLRKAQRAPAKPAAVLHWPVNDFVLAESVSTPSGVEYRVLRRWPLRGETTS